MTQIQSAARPGTLDPSFGEKGVLKLSIPGASGKLPGAVLALPDNKLLVVIQSQTPKIFVSVAKLNADGTPDDQFGVGGVVNVILPDHEMEILRGFTPLADGGWLISGQYRQGMVVLRQRKDGKLADNFGEGGVLLLPNRPGSDSEWSDTKGIEAHRHGENSAEQAPKAMMSGAVASLAEDPDGKIILAKYHWDASGNSGQAVLRLNADGSPDKSFNGTGFAYIDLGGITTNYITIVAVAVQANGRVLVCGNFQSETDPLVAFVTRFDAQGRVDPEFNRGRPLILSPANMLWTELRAIKVNESDGRIVAVGLAIREDRQNTGLIVVLNASDSFNRVFNEGQPLFSNMLPQGLRWDKCALQANGAFIVSGSGGDGYVSKDLCAVTARYLPDGSLDADFNDGDGYSVFLEEGLFTATQDMTVMGDGRIVLCGNYWVDAEPWPDVIGGWVLRYLA
ncbi:hypothetical protein [Pseudomonas sp. F01002]|uniref:hypothetical protein n=1 Tax=Pseudomonas sp. F01002 TaxID=2555724 RepID=UPI00106C3DAF|nr:hypothetical protein [Pseudomonas sp. F01002]TFB40195.1 hypothetical protein E3W21_16210 [Pseudomonas sp. F01002]